MAEKEYEFKEYTEDEFNEFAEDNNLHIDMQNVILPFIQGKSANLELVELSGDKNEAMVSIHLPCVPQDP